MKIHETNLSFYVPFFYNLVTGSSIEFKCITNPSISYTLFHLMDGTYVLVKFMLLGDRIVESDKVKFNNAGVKVDVNWEVV
jgi:hypothetical protein